MKRLALFAAAVIAPITFAPVPAVADMTAAKSMSCVPTRGASCNRQGDCKWRPATERDKAQVLVVDFGAKEAFIERAGKRRKLGVVVGDATDAGVRRVTVSRKPGDDPKGALVLLVKGDGSFSGWRAEKRIRFEGTCKAG